MLRKHSHYALCRFFENIPYPHKYSSHVHSNLDSIFPVIKTSASIPGTITINGTTYANQTCTARDEYELILNFGDIRSTCGCNVFWNFGYMAGIIVIDLSLDGVSWATVDRYSTNCSKKALVQSSFMFNQAYAAQYIRLRASNFCNDYMIISEVEVLGRYVPVLPMAAIRLKGRRDCKIEILEVIRSCTYNGSALERQ